MIKFNLGGGNKSNNNSNTNSNTPNAGKSSNSLFGGGVNLTSPSMPNLSGINKQFSNITKKMGEGLSNIPTIPNLHNTGSTVQSSAQDKKAKDDAQERKDQIAAVIAILEDVNLQCPSNHSGLILAYTGRNMSPIMSPGIKFTWFRMKGEESVEQIEETTKSWYSPSIEDIGAICVQCEDSYEQGFSKYLECGPLKADPLLKSLTETAVNSGSYEAKEIFVLLVFLPLTLPQAVLLTSTTQIIQPKFPYFALKRSCLCVVERSEHDRNGSEWHLHLYSYNKVR